MDVSCPQCETLYELDDTQLDADGATLKCSQCGHLFRLEPSAGVQSESRRRWMVRQSDSGEFLYFTGFDTLHEWIMEGRVGATDAISRTGDKWKRLGEIGEFAPIFQVVASIRDLSGEHPAEQQSGPVSDRTDSDVDSGPLETSVGDPPASREETSRPGRRSSSAESVTPAGVPAQEESRETGDETSSPVSAEDREPDDRQTDDPVEPAGPDPEQLRETRPQPQIEEGRFGTGEADESESQFEAGDGEGPDLDSGDWTLGELEHETQPATEIGDDDSSRIWPSVAVAVVAIAVAALIWQFELVEQMAADVVDDWDDETDQQIADDEDDIDADPIEAAFGELEANIGAGLEAAETELGRRMVGLVASRASGKVAEGLEGAREDADRQAREAAEPTGSQLLAAGQRSLGRGDAEQALERFRGYLEESPDSAEAMVGKGWAYQNLDEYGAAAGEFQRAYETDSEMGDALIGLGRAEAARGRIQEALSAYEEYKERFPGGDQYSIAEYQSGQLREELEE